MTKEPTQEQLETFARSHVVHVVSALVADLAKGYGSVTKPSEVADLCEKAAELFTPRQDWEEAALQEGWTGPHRDKFGATYFQDKTDGQTWACADWEELCQAHDIEPHEWEVYEHWIISDRLAELLAAEGERVDDDFAGLTIWARTTTGQSIMMDDCIRRAWRRSEAEHAALLAEIGAGKS